MNQHLTAVAVALLTIAFVAIFSRAQESYRQLVNEPDEACLFSPGPVNGLWSAGIER